MKLQTSAMLAGIAVAILAVAGCSSSEHKKSQENGMGAAPADQGKATSTAQPDQGKFSSIPQTDQGKAQPKEAGVVAVTPGQPGGLIVQTYEQTATVSKIDKETRKLTLTLEDGTRTTVKCGPDVVNFDQIQVDDKVKATIAEQLVVFVRKSGEAPPSTPELTTVAVAPVGAKPGVMMADTIEATAKVTAIDPEKHKATLQFPDGQTKTFKVREDVDLTKQQVGDEVVIRSTESMAIRVEKP